MTKNFGIKTGKIQGNKKTICSLSLVLILAVSMIMAFAQPTFAQVGVPQPEKTSGYIDVAPRLVGVGQEATVNLFIYPLPTNYIYTGYFDGYRGVTVTFVKPDGTKDTFMPTDGTGIYDPGQTQSLGAIFFFYKPNMAGDWSVSFTMPAQNLTDSKGTVLMQGCTSNTASFKVQTDPVLAGLLNGYPWSPLPNPNVFWSYPINANNREWNQISGDWLGMTNTGAIVNNPTCRLWQPYGSGPSTGHILWKNQITEGGIIGGDYGSYSYSVATSSAGLAQPVVMEGKVFVNIPSAGQFRCIDEATGAVIYTVDGSVTYGIHLPGNAYSQSGFSPTGNVVLESSFGSNYSPYLLGISGSTWNYYNPFTGKLVRSIVNASSARFIDGSELAYGVAGGKLFRWNMTKVVGNNFPTGKEWERTLPTSLISGGGGLVGGQQIFVVSADASTVVGKTVNEYWGYNAETGASIWNLTLNYPTTANQQFWLYPINDFIILDPTESTFHCYSMTTGAELWESTSFSDAVWATTWTVYYSATNDNENLYAIFSDGTMRAYSLADGHEVWRSAAIPSTEYPNNVVPYVTGLVLVDGKLYGYAGYSQSYQINPVPRHAMVVCIDAATGDTIFTLNGGVRPVAAANGYVIGTGVYDANVYCLGKGKTSTTVTVSSKTPAKDSQVLIEGTVMDMSSASPNTPAVSDADMSEWMDYLHMQNATLLNDPPTPDGVTVSVSALDSNGHYTDLGTTTSDYAGQFALSWKPTTEGLYKIFATFEGSGSYYSSYAETALSVTKALQAPTDGGTAAQPVDNTMTIIGVGVVLAIIIAIVGVLLYRKK